MRDYRYGYLDDTLITNRPIERTPSKAFHMMLAVLFLTVVWLALTFPLLFGEGWLSQTYDREEWKTVDGEMQTYGMWDLETHIWKSIYIMENFPHYNWNPYWYMGMPLLEYYQYGFYVAHIGTILATGLSPERASIVLIIFAHLLAVYLTFILCYKFSRRIWASALSATFLISNTFISIRSYGWEPITVVFIFLFPLFLIFFFREPLRPLRLELILLLAISYLSHPLLFFSLCMTMGLYLITIAFHQKFTDRGIRGIGFMWQYFALVLLALLVGAVQFIPQMSYEQVTSGAHMGVKYLPYYQVPPNILPMHEFFFDAANLKGPGPIIMIALLLTLIFFWLDTGYKRRKNENTIGNHPILMGLFLTLFTMVLFYYLELYNIFPMNLLRSIQYHRIIPEFIVVAAVLLAVLTNVARTRVHRAFYYSLLAMFVVASFVNIYIVAVQWDTTDDIYDRPEFIWETFEGRISHSFNQQSLAVRNSFTNTPQIYGYYEQGITNSYADEMMSVSSGYHNADMTVLYLKAANVARLYVNMEEGPREGILLSRLNGSMAFIHRNESDRYGYFEVPLANPHWTQAVNGTAAREVMAMEPGCRIIFQEEYCGSKRQEFIMTDPEEIDYLTAYVELLEQPYQARAEFLMIHPEKYAIEVTNAVQDTAVVLKMTHDKNFRAYVDEEEIGIMTIGPDYMLITPNRPGTYIIDVEYTIPATIRIGAIISLVSLALILLAFLIVIPIYTHYSRKRYKDHDRNYRGDM
jgi:hypothetical protein